MKKIIFYLLLIFIISCDYKSPEKDKHTEIPYFSETIMKNPLKYGLKAINDSIENVIGVFYL